MVVKELRKDQHVGWLTVPEMPHADSAPSLSDDDENGDPFTSLVMFYASKALEFPEPIYSISRSYC